MNSRQRLAALLLAGCLCDAGLSTASLASIDRGPRIETDCLRSRVVLRPQFGSSVADMQPGERMPLVQVRVCSDERRSCIANGEEVPFSRCLPGSDTVGNLTTE